MTIVDRSVEKHVKATSSSEPIHKNKAKSEELSTVSKPKKDIKKKTSTSSLERKQCDIQSDVEDKTQSAKKKGNKEMHHYYLLAII